MIQALNRKIITIIGGERRVEWRGEGREKHLITYYRLWKTRVGGGTDMDKEEIFIFGFDIHSEGQVSRLDGRMVVLLTKTKNAGRTGS